MSESFYTSVPANTASPPPPPPPKPISHLSQSADQSRSGTPILSYNPTADAATPLPQSNTDLSRPQPPLPTQQQPTLAPQPHLQQQYQPVPPPALTDRWLPQNIQSKPLTELHPLLNNDSLITSLASQHPSYQSSLQPLHVAVQANIALAQQVSHLEAQLRQLRDETAQLLLNHTSLQTQWRRKQSEMDDALAPWGPRQMYQRLVSSISEQEALLRAMQESFLEGGNEQDTYYGSANGGKASEKEVTEWVRRIREGATTLEKRREMRARWDEGRVGGWR